MIIQFLVFASSHGESTTPWWVYLGYAIAGGIAMRIVNRNARAASARRQREAESGKSAKVAKWVKMVRVLYVCIIIALIGALIIAVQKESARRKARIQRQSKTNPRIYESRQHLSKIKAHNSSHPSGKKITVDEWLDANKGVVELSLELVDACKKQDKAKVMRLANDSRLKDMHILDHALRSLCETEPFDKAKAEFLIACGADVNGLPLEARQKLHHLIENRSSGKK